MASLNAQNKKPTKELRRNVITGFLTVALVVPLIWMLMDRDPPYVRSDGEIVTADPLYCGMHGTTIHDFDMSVKAGSCVEVKWVVKTIRNCPAASNGDNVTRHLKDSIGITQPIGSLRRNIFEHESPNGVVQQFLILPSPLPAGLTTYISSACFACNPLQKMFWPVCVDKPDIQFEVEK